MVERAFTSSAVGTSNPATFARRQAPLELGRAYYATEGKSASPFLFKTYTRRGRLRLEGGALVFESGSELMLVTQVWDIQIRCQRFPWASMGISVAALPVLALAVVLTGAGDALPLLAGWLVGVPVGVVSARAARWVRIQHGDPSLPPQVAWFAPSGLALFWGGSRLRQAIEAGLGGSGGAPSVTPYARRRAGSP